MLCFLELDFHSVLALLHPLQESHSCIPLIVYGLLAHSRAPFRIGGCWRGRLQLPRPSFASPCPSCPRAPSTSSSPAAPTARAAYVQAMAYALKSLRIALMHRPSFSLSLCSCISIEYLYILISFVRCLLNSEFLSGRHACIHYNDNYSTTRVCSRPSCSCAAAVTCTRTTKSKSSSAPLWWTLSTERRTSRRLASRAAAIPREFRPMAPFRGTPLELLLQEPQQRLVIIH